VNVHFILGMDIFQCLLAPFERIIDGDIQVSFILTVRSTCEFPIDNLVALQSIKGDEKRTYTYNKRILQVKHSLFPVRVLCVWPCTEPHRFMTRLESNIKPRNNRVYEIVSCSTEFEICEESEIADRTSIEIEVEDSIRVGDDGFEFDGINQGLSQCDCCNGGEVETIHGFPEPDFFFFIVGVFDSGDVQGGVIREN